MENRQFSCKILVNVLARHQESFKKFRGNSRGRRPGAPPQEGAQSGERLASSPSGPQADGAGPRWELRLASPPTKVGTRSYLHTAMLLRFSQDFHKMLTGNNDFPSPPPWAPVLTYTLRLHCDSLRNFLSFYLEIKASKGPPRRSQEVPGGPRRS